MEKNPIEQKIDETIEKVCDKSNPYVEIYKKKLEKLLRIHSDAQRKIA